jgi:hypothetical protein
MGHHGLHATVEMRPPRAAQAVPIDVGLAELIALLWAHGLPTVECCQDDVEMTPGHGFVTFKSVASAVRFVRQIDRWALHTDAAGSGMDFHMQLQYDGRMRVLLPVGLIGLATDAWKWDGTE